MHRQTTSIVLPAVWRAVAFLAVFAAAARGDLTPDQAKRIREAAPAKARAVPRQPRRVLIWNTPYMEQSPHKGYTIPQGAFAIRTLGEKTGAFEAVVSDDQSLLLPEQIRQFDVFVMNNSCGPWTTPTDQAMPRFAKYGADKDDIEKQLRKGFLEWVRAGGGVVAYHYSIGAARHWPELERLLGASCGGHPWNEEIGVKLDEPDHPLLRVFGGKDFRIAEEVFQYLAPYARDKVRVLLSIDTKTTNMGVPWLKRTDNDYALAWVKSYGKGRVFYSEFGHRTEVWWNPAILEFYLDAIQFAAGDLDAPVEPR
ncbi:MAG: ThuA domain-containing protein [Pirellulales bacterium]|nr:ThuA domain-containing protein [Pirellulales bacterium]